MKLKTFFTIFLLLPAVITAWKTKFDFVGTFKCEHPGVWCLSLWYRELDLTERFHDDYGKLRQLCTSGNTIIKRHQVYDGADGMFNRWYEPSVTVTHNCTGIEITFLHQFDDVDVYLTYVPVFYEMDLSN